MKICEVPNYTLDYDYIFALNTFLDEFYECDDKEKSLLLVDEPIGGILNIRQYCTLAAAAHKLANEYFLAVPSWTMKEEYIMPYSIYAFGASKKEEQDLLKVTTPNEYKIRNLFLGSKVLKRI